MALVTICLPGQSCSAESVGSRQDILLELSLTFKALAEDQFINGDRAAAAENYDSAQNTIEKIKPARGWDKSEEVELVREEIEYRRSLLAVGASFWGLEFQGRPSNTVAAWQRLEQTQKRFAEAVTSVISLIGQTGETNDAAVSDKLKEIKATEDEAVHSLEMQSADTERRYAAVRRGMLQDRMAAVVARQEAIASQRISMQAEMAATAASINQTLINSAVSYMGLPPDTTAVLTDAAKGDLSSALKGAVVSYATSDAAPGLDGKLGALVDDARRAASEFKQLQETVKKGKDLAESSAELMRAIQSGNTSRILSSGAALYKNLPADTQRQIASGLAQNRTLESAITLSRKGTELRTAVAKYVGASPGFAEQIDTLFSRYLDPANPTFDSHYSEILRAIIEHAPKGEIRQGALSAMVQSWADTFVDDVIDRSSVIDAAKLLGAVCPDALACRNEVIKRLKNQGLSGLTVTVSGDGMVVISRPGVPSSIIFNLQRFAEQSVQRPIETEKAKIQDQIKEVASTLAQQRSQLAGAILEAIPDEDFDGEVAPLLAQLEKSEQISAVNAISPANADGSDVLTASVAAFSVGRDLAGEIAKSGSAAKAGSPIADASVPAKDPAQSAQDQQILAAMAAAGPYGAAAATAIKLISSIESLGDLVDEANRLDSEDRELTVELLHLAPMNIEIQRDESLAVNAGQIAKAQVTSAQQRSGLLFAHLLQIGNTSTDLGRQISYQLRLTYFLAELLRRQYDALDQSLAFWSGQPDPAHGFIQSVLRSDKHNLRLAIDPEIRLYDWFNRSKEGERKDLSALAGHWAELIAVARQICQDTGCVREIGQTGLVDRTEAIRLSGIPYDVAEASSGANHIHFTLIPQYLPDLPHLDRLRLVDVAVAIEDKATKQFSAPVNVRVRHSGLGYILADGEGRREVLEASGEAVPKYPLTDDELAKLVTRLQTRWAQTDNVDPMEGYPLFGLYEISVPPSFNIKSQDLKIVFFYQRPKISEPLEIGLQDEIVNCKDSNVKIDPKDVRLLIRRNNVGDLRNFDAVPEGPACALAEEVASR
ncbi:hypothetical protein ACCS62_28500 [Rhizobium ruizarguesonis]